MAKATGVDLVRAFNDGHLTQEDWAGIVTRCRGCQWVGGCNRWLDTLSEEERAFPEPCINHKTLSRLKTASKEPET